MLDNTKISNNLFELTKVDLSSYKERQMKRRIEALIKKKGFTSFAEYFDKVKKDKDALEEFLEHITINVSEFYRNPEQWYILENDVLPHLLERFGSDLNIWSAACSTGDEPYSLVMLLDKLIPNNRIKVLATDLDKSVLEIRGLIH